MLSWLSCMRSRYLSQAHFLALGLRGEESKELRQLRAVGVILVATHLQVLVELLPELCPQALLVLLLLLLFLLLLSSSSFSSSSSSPPDSSSLASFFISSSTLRTSFLEITFMILFCCSCSRDTFRASRRSPQRPSRSSGTVAAAHRTSRPPARGGRRASPRTSWSSSCPSYQREPSWAGRGWI